MSITTGLIGARGYTGKELLALILDHPQFQLICASSREMDGQAVSAYVGRPGTDVVFRNIQPEDIPKLDSCILALPNGYAASYVEALLKRNPDCVICDLSADYRFDQDWYYGLPELYRAASSDKKLIANPGCYATAMQLAIAPIVDQVKDTPRCFGVSGFSGAGTKPSDKNNEELLADNLMPYSPVNHIHEREVSRHLNHPVHFMPHVAQFFRGISMTVDLTLKEPMQPETVFELFATAYRDEALVQIQESIPQISQVRFKQNARVGGFSMSQDGTRLVVYSVLDNLLKGAASQALQNLNNAFDLPETQGLSYE